MNEVVAVPLDVWVNDGHHLHTHTHTHTISGSTHWYDAAHLSSLPGETVLHVSRCGELARVPREIPEHRHTHSPHTHTHTHTHVLLHAPLAIGVLNIQPEYVVRNVVFIKTLIHTVHTHTHSHTVAGHACD